MVSKKIAIIEDEGIVALNLRYRLEAANYAVTGIADSVNSALSLVADTAPDLILMDVELKGQDTGIEIAQTIHDRWKIPVIFVTGYSDPDTLHSAKKTDPFGFLVKPIDLTELYSTIEIALQKHHDQQHLKQLVEERTCELALANARLQLEVEERQRASSEIVQAIDELKELKSRFISTASHEFRTPLSIVLTSAELLERLGSDCPEERRSRYVEKIREAVRSMTTILTNALTLRKTDTEGIEPHPNSFDLHQFCVSLLSDFPRKIELHHTGDCTQVTLDTELLTLILQNLLSNAIKFSPPDQPIELKVQCSPNRVIFTVSDRGFGIPKEDLSRIFEPFHRAKNTNTIAGGGLGLAIVKQCVELHGGTIDIKSELGRGTIVQVSLPMS
jgi:signal transduction histidine kinase